MSKAKKYPDLPKHIVKFNRYFYKDTKTLQFIHKDNLADHIPKKIVETPSWHTKYDNY